MVICCGPFKILPAHNVNMKEYTDKNKTLKRKMSVTEEIPKSFL